MSRTLVLLFHRDFAKSKANAALANAATRVPGVDLVDMQACYPDGKIDFARDGETEARRLLSADRLVLQFPMQWYSTPAFLKDWQDAVLTRMFYIHPRKEGSRLAGLPLMVSVTAGNVPGAYARDGQNYFTMEEILTPLKATAYRCGMRWHEPNVVYRADRLEDADLQEAAFEYQCKLERFASAVNPDEIACASAVSL